MRLPHFTNAGTSARLTKTACKDLAPFNIRVNAISPALIGPGACAPKAIKDVKRCLISERVDTGAVYRVWLPLGVCR